MDRLRSLQYVVAAAEAGSFSGAARRLDVSVTAVAKLVSAFERELGSPLFNRHPAGLSLTTAGERYLQSCKPAMAMLEHADEALKASVSPRPSGTLLVAVQPVILQECLGSALPRFHECFPDIQLDLRYLLRVDDDQRHGHDVVLAMGWHQIDDMVHRRIAAARFAVCAAPSYWRTHGTPKHPRELEEHNCLCIRKYSGTTVMDLWNFVRGEERVSVAARGWLIADNPHRDVLIDAVRAGSGVARMIFWEQRQAQRMQTPLVPVLTDWESTEVVPVNLFYPASVRRVARVRAFIDFVTQVFQEPEMQNVLQAAASPAPHWLSGRRWRARASATMGADG